MTDALPLLRRAQQVQGVWWNEGGMPDDTPMAQRRLATLQQWLAWQGVMAEVQVQTTRLPISEALLSRHRPHRDGRLRPRTLGRGRAGGRFQQPGCASCGACTSSSQPCC